MGRKDKQAYNEYMRVYMLKRYHKRMEEAKARLGGKCAVCGFIGPHLEFDHKDAKDKLFTISQLWSLSEKIFWAEIEKCQLLCGEHHLEKSLVEGDFVGGHNKIIGDRHGKLTGYYDDGCRCDRCLEFATSYKKKEVDSVGNVVDEQNDYLTAKWPFKPITAGTSFANKTIKSNEDVVKFQNEISALSTENKRLKPILESMKEEAFEGRCECGPVLLQNTDLDIFDYSIVDLRYEGGSSTTVSCVIECSKCDASWIWGRA